MQTPVVNAQQAGLAAASADMNAYAAACQFLLSPPSVVAYAKTSAQSITGGTVTAINWAKPVRDNDLTWQPAATSQFILNTQGFYEFAAHVFLTSAATTAECFIRVTTGAGNPSGSGIVNNWWHSDMITFTGTSIAAGVAGILPVVCYPGDTLQFMVNAQNTCTTAQNASTGYWGDYSHRLVSL